jgi:hypothetical protein
MLPAVFKINFGQVNAAELTAADWLFSSLLERNALIVMPPFRHSGGRQFTEAKNCESYNVASVLIHVERAFARMKIFDILKGLENSLLPQVDMILVAISYSCNNF